MDTRLKAQLESWRDHIEVVREAEEKFLLLEASEESLEAELYLQAEGKTLADKNAMVHASKDWKDFKRGLAVAKSQCNYARRTLELKQKAYEAEYLTMKMEGEAVRHAN